MLASASMQVLSHRLITAEQCQVEEAQLSCSFPQKVFGIVYCTEKLLHTASWEKHTGKLGILKILAVKAEWTTPLMLATLAITS